MLSKGLERLKSGDFNDMMQKRQPDGSVIITLSKRGEDKPVKFRVKNLYQKNEQEVDIGTGKPISKRDLQTHVPKVPGKAGKGRKGQGG
jgi:hypothetical protein